jgi:hypothetical protein
MRKRPSRRTVRDVAADWRRLADEAGLRAVPPPDVSRFHGAEEALGRRLSDSLSELYAQTNGLLDEWGYAYVLSISELVELNRKFRSQYGDLYMSFNDVVLFGQLGNGDMFFQPSIPEAVASSASSSSLPRRYNEVFVWDHEGDSRTWYGRDVEDAIRRFTAGEPR